MNHIYGHLESTKFFNRIAKKPTALIYDRQKPWWDQILDPNGEFVTKWNYIFLFTSLMALFIDPCFLFLPKMREHNCMEMDFIMAYLLILGRTIVDLFSVLHIAMKFRTAYIAPSSRVFGKGELVLDPPMIAVKYIKSDFMIDAMAALPLPQIVIWSILPRARDPTAAHQNHSISLVIVVQYIPRLLVIFPLNARIIKNTGVVAKNALSGALYNLGIYMLASHVLGAIWYLMAFERYYSCWMKQCKLEKTKRMNPCLQRFLDCRYSTAPDRQIWANSTQVFDKCSSKGGPDNFDFGMFEDVYKDEVTSTSFYDKFFYCLWWGLRNLSSYGQNLVTSTSVVETLFSSLICLAGLVFFSLLIGNMQSYLQSITTRLEEWRVKRKDTEEWMRHRQLPPELQERVRRFVQYQWLATRGVHEEEILTALPLDLRRQIQRHLCLAIVRRVPFFSQMDDQLLDAICERLVPSLNTKDTYIVREGDPVNDMLFIIRGQLESSTTNGGRSGFFNSIILKPGDFCGEELLTWALMPTSSMNLPSSTRTAKAITEVEAFSLRAQDLKFVANQFRRLHSKKLQHAFRYYSQQWRTWGACFIQTAWRRLKRRRLAEELYREEENMYYYDDEDDGGGGDVPQIVPQQDNMGLNDNVIREGSGGGDNPHGEGSRGHNVQHLGATILASKFAANTRRGAAGKIIGPSLEMPKKLLKPDDPDFSAAVEEEEEDSKEKQGSNDFI